MFSICKGSNKQLSLTGTCISCGSFVRVSKQKAFPHSTPKTTIKGKPMNKEK